MARRLESLCKKGQPELRRCYRLRICSIGFYGVEWKARSKITDFAAEAHYSVGVGLRRAVWIVDTDRLDP